MTNKELLALLDTSNVPSHFTIALTKKEADAIAAPLRTMQDNG